MQTRQDAAFTVRKLRFSPHGSDTMRFMEPQDFWNTYMQGIRPADFMSAFDEADPTMCVTEYVRQRPALYGIVRRRNWRETFVAGEPQYTRESVRAALITHLEETRPEWESVSAEIRHRRQEERRRRIEEATRREAVAATAPPPPPVVEPEPETPVETPSQPEVAAAVPPPSAAEPELSAAEPVQPEAAVADAPAEDSEGVPPSEAASSAAD